jgi:hypothetical protein
MQQRRIYPFKAVLRLILLLVITIALLMVVSNYPAFIEHYYTRGFYRGVCFVLHPLFNLLPFSAGDVFYVVVVFLMLYVLYQLVLLLIRRHFERLLVLLLKIVAALLIGVVWFYVFWGLNYYRPSAAALLSLQDTSYTVKELTAVTTMMVDSANQGRARLSNCDLEVDNRHIFEVAKRAVISLSNSSSNFFTSQPEIKPSLLAPILNYIGTSGYYNPFTSESQINGQMPVALRPFVACHEMSHQMGFAAEDEANFTGFLAGIRSGDGLLTYSAYYLGMEEFMHALHHRDSIAYKRLKKAISPAVRKDLIAEKNYWLRYEGQVSVITSIFYDKFLKANNQPKGLQTYNQMIRLAMSYYSTHGIAYRTTPSRVKTKSP